MSFEQRLDQTLTLNDGRRLGFAELGDAAGAPVIYCHGFPASRLEGRLIASAAERRKARVIVPDRPGYGLSDRKPERTIAEWADDVAELAAALGLERFSVLAVSGGAPYGLALAARLAGRVEGAAVVCGLGPVYRPEALRSMHWPGRYGFQWARTAPGLTRLVYGGLLGRLMRVRPEFALFLLTVAIPESDRRTLSRPEVRAVLAASVREALRPGVEGPLMDLGLYARDWGFDPAGIKAPVTFWHGEADATVPVSHVALLAEWLPHAEVRRLAGEGHFSLPIERADDILGVLLSRARTSASP
jgi:pimeloyl-ACP methyl ester carboxylesterase